MHKRTFLSLFLIWPQFWYCLILHPLLWSQAKATVKNQISVYLKFTSLKKADKMFEKKNNKNTTIHFQKERGKSKRSIKLLHQRVVVASCQIQKNYKTVKIEVDTFWQCCVFFVTNWHLLFGWLFSIEEHNFDHYNLTRPANDSHKASFSLFITLG